MKRTLRWMGSVVLGRARLASLPQPGGRIGASRTDDRSLALHRIGGVGPGTLGPAGGRQDGSPLPRWLMKERLSSILSMLLFVVLAGYVAWSGLRLGLLLWQRFGAG
jgi:hypothetical protein